MILFMWQDDIMDVARVINACLESWPSREGPGI